MAGHIAQIIQIISVNSKLISGLPSTSEYGLYGLDEFGNLWVLEPEGPAPTWLFVCASPPKP